MAKTTSPEPRQCRRRHLIYYLQVFDHENGAALGRVVDITHQGIKLVSREEIPCGTTFRLRMALPKSYSSHGQIVFDATSVWSGRDVKPNFFATGFTAPDMPPHARDLIADLIKRMGFRG